MVSTSLAPRRRWLKVLAVIGALALVVAACGGDNGNGNGTTEGREGDTGESADAQHGGSITYAVEGDTLNFCLPMAQLAISGIMIANGVYDTLVTQNADGEIVPFLAESLEHDDDGTVWTMTLREGVEFHNGEPFDAEAAIMNLNAYRGAVVAPDVNDGLPFGSTLFKYVFGVPTDPDDVLPYLAGADPDDFEGQLIGIQSLEATDSHTVEITMHEPWYDFPSFLYSTGRIGMLAPEQLRGGTDEDGTCQTQMIGTGPFAHANPGEVREPLLERNESYWREDSEGRQLPYLDAVQFRIQPDGQQRLNGIQGGQFDLAHFSLGEDVGAAIDMSEAGNGFAYVEQPGFREVGYLLINNGKAPFDNEDARKAVYLAANRDQINSLINEGYFELSSGLFDEDVGGNLPLGDDGLPDTSDRDQALEEARQHAQAYEAATGSPLSFEALTTNVPTNTRILEILQQSLAEAGIDMTISSPVLQSEIINLAVGGALGTALEDAPEAFLWRNHPGSQYCSAQSVWFLSGSPVNFAIIHDEEVDRLFIEGRQTSDADERADRCRELNEHMNENVYNGWTWWTDWTILTGNTVNGVWGPPLPDGSDPVEGIAGIHRLDGIWLGS